MKRYNNNNNNNNISVILGERTIRIIHDGLVNEVLLTSGIKYTYELEEVDCSYKSSYVDTLVLPTSHKNQVLMNTSFSIVPVLARVVGLYKRSLKMKKNRNKRRLVVKGRLVSVGTKLGIVRRKSLFARHDKKLITCRDRKIILCREVGKLYKVVPVGLIKKIIVYKPVSHIVL